MFKVAKEGENFVVKEFGEITKTARFIEIDEACQRCKRWQVRFRFKSAEFCQGFHYGRGELRSIISEDSGITCPRQDEDFLKEWEASQI